MIKYLILLLFPVFAFAQVTETGGVCSSPTSGGVIEWPGCVFVPDVVAPPPDPVPAPDFTGCTAYQSGWYCVVRRDISAGGWLEYDVVYLNVPYFGYWPPGVCPTIPAGATLTPACGVAPDPDPIPTPVGDQHLPNTCSSLSACMSVMASGDVLLIGDGTYSSAVTGIKAGTIVQAENDGKVIFTGNFNPGSAGFTMRGIIVRRPDQSNLGGNNTYERMSFDGGPSSGNTVNSTVGAGTTIRQSAFYGLGGRYLLLSYQQKGALITIEDVIFRPDGGWFASSDPVAAFNMYDSENFIIHGAIVIDGRTDGGSSVLGGPGVNTHQAHGSIGTIEQSVAVGNGSNFGRFWSDGQGTNSHNVIDSVSYGNADAWGMTRNTGGTTTATRFDTDKQIGSFKGSISRTPGANLVLNKAFLDDPRWKAEMAAVRSSGWTTSGLSLSAYIESFLP